MQTQICTIDLLSPQGPFLIRSILSFHHYCSSSFFIILIDASTISHTPHQQCPPIMSLERSCRKCDILFNTEHRLCPTCSEMCRWTCSASGRQGLYKNKKTHIMRCINCSPDHVQAIHEQNEAEKENRITNIMQQDAGHTSAQHHRPSDGYPCEHSCIHPTCVCFL